MTKHFKHYMAAVALSAIALSAQAEANHLVLSEVGIYPLDQTNDASAEYVEIYNPTAATVSLDNYYLTDTNNYSGLPASASGKVSGATTDHVVRFPAGFQLLPGQVAVVTGGATNFFTEFFGGLKSNYDVLPGAPLIFEVGPTNAEVPDMISLNNSATRPVNFNLTNPSATNGEFSILFYWNGIRDVVTDVDMASWGTPTTANSANGFVPKTDFPYQPDAGTNGNLSITTSANVVTRVSLAEDAEVSTGGSGLTGHDESTEVTATNWTASLDRGTMTPGTTTLPLSTTNTPPFVNSVERDKQFPTSADQITITANVTDGDGTVSGVKFLVNSGAGFVETAATAVGTSYSVTVGPFVDGTVVKYYVEATDEDSSVTRFPSVGARPDNKVFVVDNNPATSIVINEIQYDIIGTDSYEWLELYNTSSTTVTLSQYRVGDASAEYFTFPDNAVIAANGYVVLSFNPTAMAADFTLPAGVPVYQYPFSLGNSSDRIYVSHPNGFRFNGVTTYVDDLTYSSTADGWPVTTSNTTGQSIELNSPDLDNAIGSNWHGHPALVVEGTPKNSGTPGAQNTMADVSDWAIY